MKGNIVEKPSEGIDIMRLLFPGLQEMKSVAAVSLEFSLTRNLSCASIISVEIEETCPVTRTGRDHEGPGRISIGRIKPSLIKIQLKGSQNEYLCG